MAVNQKAMKAMKKQYGDKKGEQVYYASVNNGTLKESETMRRIREVIATRPK
jgi:hypothetical protein